jgi:hypothetical protein
MASHDADDRGDMEARVSEWISVNDRLPDSDREVLIRMDDGAWGKGWDLMLSNGMIWFESWDDTLDKYNSPTHWMDIPEVVE